MPLHDSEHMMNLMNKILPYTDEKCNVREDAPDDIKEAAKEYARLAYEQEVKAAKLFVEE